VVSTIWTGDLNELEFIVSSLERFVNTTDEGVEVRWQLSNSLDPFIVQ
jgi:hypothetical protein